jgi:hypothetical protein
MDYEIETLESPAYVTDAEAAEYLEEGNDDFTDGGWYIPAEVRHKQGEYEGHAVGSIVQKYFGPFGTEEAALLEVPKIAPGILVKLG